MTERDAALLDEFCDQLWLEDGLAKNTLESYRRDLALYAGWLAARGGSLDRATEPDVLGYFAFRHAGAKRPRPSTQARIASSLKRFYQFLVRANRIAADPTLKLEPPKRPPRFPKALAEADVEALLAAPDVGTPLGLRDRAMLEVLYATGLRVSELVRLKPGEVNLGMGVVRVFGKGSKERMVPLGEEAIAWLTRYQREARPAVLQGRAGGVRDRARGRDDPAGVLASHQALRRARRSREGALAAHAAPRVRDAPPQPWRRPARRAAAARARRYHDHADLHARRARAPESAAREASPARLKRAPRRR